MTAIATRTPAGVLPGGEPRWRDLPSAPDIAFAERSAAYLGSLGYRADEVRQTLMDELQLSEFDAQRIVNSIASPRNHAA